MNNTEIYGLRHKLTIKANDLRTVRIWGQSLHSLPESSRLPSYPALMSTLPMPAFPLSEHVTSSGNWLIISSVQFSRSVVSDSLRPHESQHARPPCPSPTPGVHSDSHPSNQWCHPAISSSVILFSSCPQSLPASESFPMSQCFTCGGQSTGVSALASFLPKKFQGWSPSEWTGWISLQSKGLSRVFSNTTVQKHQFFGAQPSSQPNSHIHTWPQEKPQPRRTLVGKVTSLLLNYNSKLWLIIISDKDKYFPDQQTILWCASNPYEDAKFFPKMH